MAKLLIKTEGLENTLIELRLGINRLGRSADADFQINHATVSSLHCELVLRDSGVLLRDLESTNGTFLNNQPVREAELSAGQTLRLGDVELLVDNTEANVAIPKFANTELPAPPVVKADGDMACPRHRSATVTHQCTHCHEVMCFACIHRLRRKGGQKTLNLCPICSGTVEILGGAPKPAKRSVFARVGETVKLAFKRTVNLDK